MIQELRDWFWDEKFWLHNSATWKDFENPPPNAYYPLQKHLIIPSILIGIAMLGVRFMYERFLVVPFAKYMGIKPKRVYVINKNQALEKLYSEDKFLQHTRIQEVAKKTSLTERQIQIWFRHKRYNEAPGRMKKFLECSWHFLFYFSSFVVGLAILWNKPFFWETKYFWIDYPRHNVTDDMFWYYLIEFSFYWNLMFTLLSDHKRKDFTTMVVHHIVTMALIYFSFITNLLRLGSIVIILHDAADYWMAAGKMALYLKKEALADILFVVFCIVWVCSRLCLFPLRILWPTLTECLDYADEIGSIYYLFNGLLWLLLVLNFFWSYIIVRMVSDKVTGNKKFKDARSDTESSNYEEEDDDEEEEIIKTNGSTPVSNTSFSARIDQGSINGLKKRTS